MSLGVKVDKCYHRGLGRWMAVAMGCLVRWGWIGPFVGRVCCSWNCGGTQRKTSGWTWGAFVGGETRPALTCTARAGGGCSTSTNAQECSRKFGNVGNAVLDKCDAMRLCGQAALDLTLSLRIRFVERGEKRETASIGLRRPGLRAREVELKVKLCPWRGKRGGKTRGWELLEQKIATAVACSGAVVGALQLVQCSIQQNTV